MITLYQIALFFVAPLIISALALIVYRAYCLRTLKLDNPDARSSHKDPTPTGAGFIFILIAGLFALYWSLISETEPLPFLQDRQDYFFLLGAFGLLSLIGLFDDYKNLPALWRLFPQMAFVGASLYQFFPTDFSLLNGVISGPLLWVILFFGWVWFINLYNFMDGIDGITTIQSLFLLGGLWFFSPGEPLFFLILGACLIGFLLHNAPPAKLFMGDSGSVPLGYLLGFFFIHIAALSEAHFYIALILPAYYLIDSGYTLIKRLLNKQKPWQAHREHFYQQLTTSEKQTHRRALTYLILANVITLSWALITWRDLGEMPYIGFIGAYLSIGLGLIYVLRKRATGIK